MQLHLRNRRRSLSKNDIRELSYEEAQLDDRNSASIPNFGNNGFWFEEDPELIAELSPGKTRYSFMGPVFLSRSLLRYRHLIVQHRSRFQVAG